MLHRLKSVADIFSTETFHFEQFLGIITHGYMTDTGVTN